MGGWRVAEKLDRKRVQSAPAARQGWYASKTMSDAESTLPRKGSLLPERLPHVDSLRLVAAGLVVLQHFSERAPGRVAAALTALGPGVAGVVLFFLISGYVIPFSVRGGRLDWRRFAVRRVLRIYPLLLAALALVAFAGWAGALEQWRDLPQAGAGRWLANLLLMQDFVGAQPILGVSWTLIFELAWYGLFAAALLALGPRAGNVLAVFVPVVLLVLAALSLASGLRIPLGRPGLIHAAVLGYQAYRMGTGALSPRGFGWNVAAFLGVTWLVSAVSFGVYTHAHITLAQVIGPWTLALGLFLAVLLVPALRGCALLAHGWVPRLGAASYSVYLLHPIAMAAALQYVPGAMVPVAGVLTALLAWGGYRLVEMPGIAVARRLTAVRPSAAAMASAVPA